MIQQLVDKYSRDNDNELVVGPSESYHLVDALIGHRAHMLKCLASQPFDKNVFVIINVTKNDAMYGLVKERVERCGFNAVRADDASFWDITKDIYNPIAVLYCCKYGIALFDEPEKGSNYSPNVSYELGMMHLQRKECLILKHSTLPEMPFDLLSKLYKKYSDFDVVKILDTWLKPPEHI